MVRQLETYVKCTLYFIYDESLEQIKVLANFYWLTMPEKRQIDYLRIEWRGVSACKENTNDQIKVSVRVYETIREIKEDLRGEYIADSIKREGWCKEEIAESIGAGLTYFELDTPEEARDFYGTNKYEIEEDKGMHIYIPLYLDDIYIENSQTYRKEYTNLSVSVKGVYEVEYDKRDFVYIISCCDDYFDEVEKKELDEIIIKKMIFVFVIIVLFVLLVVYINKKRKLNL